MTQTSGYTSDGIGYQKQDTSYKAATKNKILISGDTEVAQKLQSIFSEIDIIN